MSAVKEEAKKIIETLSDTDGWEDIMYKIYVRESIERGLDDLKKGKILSEEQVEERFSSLCQKDC